MHMAGRVVSSIGGAQTCAFHLPFILLFTYFIVLPFSVPLLLLASSSVLLRALLPSCNPSSCRLAIVQPHRLREPQDVLHHDVEDPVWPSSVSWFFLLTMHGAPFLCPFVSYMLILPC